MEKTARDFLMEKEAFLGTAVSSGLKFAGNIMRKRGVRNALDKVNIGKEKRGIVHKNLNRAQNWISNPENMKKVNYIGYGAAAGTLGGAML